MPLGGFSCDQVAEFLGLQHSSKATQSWDPAVIKVARGLLVDPLATQQALVEAMELIRRDPPMTPHEWQSRRLMQTGRLDRSVLHPS